jgi:hypothetical protein
MGVKVQYNPSTGKASYNPATGKVQVVPDDTVFCSACEGDVSIQIKLTISDVTLCCSREIIDTGLGSNQISQSLLDLINAEHILTARTDTPAECFWQIVYDISEDVYVWNSATDCVLPSDQTIEFTRLRVDLNLIGASTLRVVVGMDQGGGNFIFIAQWNSTFSIPCFDQTLFPAVDTDCDAQSLVLQAPNNWTPWTVDGSVIVEDA